MTFVALNGRLLPENEAAIFCDDRGFLYGDGVFTTLRCYRGAPFRLERHVARLNASLASPEVEIPLTLDAARLRETIARLVEANRAPEAVVRLYVTRGRGVGPLPPPRSSPTLLLTVTPHAPRARSASAEAASPRASGESTSQPPSVGESTPPRPGSDAGSSLHLSSVRRDPRGTLGRHKWMSYAPLLLARREAARAGCDEGVISDTEGNILECACSNLFLVEAGRLVTPGTDQNILPGIARATVLECARSLGIEARFERITPERAGRADEAFLTNAVLEVAPVRRIAGRDLPSSPGPVTARLREAYADWVRAARP